MLQYTPVRAERTATKFHTSAPAPDAVIIYGDLPSPKDVDWLKSEGVALRPQSPQANDRPAGQRIFADTGLMEVAIDDLLDELGTHYRPASVWMEEPRPGKFKVAVAYARTTEKPDATATTVVGRLLTGWTWKYIHVWANPHMADGRRTDAVVCVWRQHKRPSLHSIAFNEGQWESVPLD